jgi:hypothetical protein
MIVSDNDADYQTSFDKICEQINHTGFGPAPAEELVPSTATVPITIAMIPPKRLPGNLECVLVHAARRKKRSLASNVDTFSGLVGAEGAKWTGNRRGKMWLRCWLAVACESDPFVPLERVFDKRADLIPMNDHAFDRLAKALAEFAT